MNQTHQIKTVKVIKRNVLRGQPSEQRERSLRAESIFLTAPEDEINRFFLWLKRLPSPLREEAFIDCCIRARLPDVALLN